MSIHDNNQAETPNVNPTKKPRSEDAVKRQIFTYSKKFLAGQAAERAKLTGVYTAPTDEDIKVECKKRWQKRLERNTAKEDVSAYFD